MKDQAAKSVEDKKKQIERIKRRWSRQVRFGFIRPFQVAMILVGFLFTFIIITGLEGKVFTLPFPGIYMIYIFLLGLMICGLLLFPAILGMNKECIKYALELMPVLEKFLMDPMIELGSAKNPTFNRWLRVKLQFGVKTKAPPKVFAIDISKVEGEKGYFTQIVIYTTYSGGTALGLSRNYVYCEDPEIETVLQDLVKVKPILVDYILTYLSIPPSGGYAFTSVVGAFINDREITYELLKNGLTYVRSVEGTFHGRKPLVWAMGDELKKYKSQYFYRCEHCHRLVKLLSMQEGGELFGKLKEDVQFKCPECGSDSEEDCHKYPYLNK